MIITVDDNLTDLFDGLKRMNYDVHRASEKVISDVYVYSAEGNMHLDNVPVNSILENGVFIVNGDNKNIEDIVSIVQNRSYSSLF